MASATTRRATKRQRTSDVQLHELDAFAKRTFQSPSMYKYLLQTAYLPVCIRINLWEELQPHHIAMLHAIWKQDLAMVKQLESEQLAESTESSATSIWELDEPEIPWQFYTLFAADVQSRTCAEYLFHRYIQAEQWKTVLPIALAHGMVLILHLGITKYGAWNDSMPIPRITKIPVCDQLISHKYVTANQLMLWQFKDSPIPSIVNHLGSKHRASVPAEFKDEYDAIVMKDLADDLSLSAYIKPKLRTLDHLVPENDNDSEDGWI